MTPERWAKITETFDAALALPLPQRGQYLAEACAGDDDLRSQVDSLLASHAIAEATDSGRWSVGPLLALQHEAQQHEPAERIGPYEVLGKIGAGGMAEVYRVRDERLGREVALKMLLPEFAGDKEYVERFHREARAASVLEHPNICRLYDIGVWNGRPYLTMELLEGQTLRQRMNAGPIPVEEILRIGADFADALAAAHARTFVHRDIKPGNIFLTDAGEVKILDFGLAKRMRSKAGNHPDEITLTNPHTTPGTPYYMAPEQILGDDADARTDTFAAGIVLYEMAAGRPPFTGENAQAVFRQILSTNPQPPIRFRDGIPRELDRIILRALEKNRDYRYQTALDLRAELKRLAKELETPSASHQLSGSQQPKGQTRRWWIAGSAIALGSAATTSLLLPTMRRRTTTPRILPIDSSPGFKEGPVFSPDGARIAYSIIREGTVRAELLVRQVGLGTSVRLSRSAGSDTWPVWSPDGSYIAFRRDGRDAGYYTIPSLGGGETKFADAGARPTLMGGNNLAWAPDGSWLAFAESAGSRTPAGIFAISHPSREVRKLADPAPFLALPAISPDGKRIAYLRGTSYQAHDLYVQLVDGGTPYRVTHDHRWIAGLTWTPDSRSIIYSSDRGGLFLLWKIAASGGEPELVPAAGPDVFSPSLSRDGRRLAFVRRTITVNLWRMPLKPIGAPEKLTGSVRMSADPDLSPNGKKLALASDRSGSWEIWVSDADGSKPGRITALNAGQTRSPRWSPDGRWIAFDARPAGHGDIYITGAEGISPRPVTTGEFEDSLPTWSRDGRAIYFISDRSGGRQLWRVAAVGGNPQQITRNGADFGLESPDGTAIYYARSGTLIRLNLQDGAESIVTKNLNRADFDIAGTELYFATRTETEFVTIEKIDLATGMRSIVAENIGPRPGGIGAISVSQDGQYLLYERVDQNDSEIMMIEAEKF